MVVDQLRTAVAVNAATAGPKAVALQAEVQRRRAAVVQFERGAWAAKAEAAELRAVADRATRALLVKSLVHGGWCGSMDAACSALGSWARRRPQVPRPRSADEPRLPEARRRGRPPGLVPPQ